MLINHHAHTRFSDGRGEPEEYVLEAIRQGFTGYGFSDHAPIPLVDVGNMEMDLPQPYGIEIERLRKEYGNRIDLYKSLEVDYIPQVVNVNSPHILDAGLDYTIGAVHYVDYLPDGQPWSFQRANPIFERGIETIFGGSARRMVERYFALIREMAETNPPDIVAHLDRVKKHNVGGKYWDEHSPWYRATLEATLDVIAAAGCVMEVNTRGIYLGETKDTYPTGWIVRLAHERGIPLQVNSDAHRSRHISGGFTAAYTLLLEIGVEEVSVFDGKEFVSVGIARMRR